MKQKRTNRRNLLPLTSFYDVDVMYVESVTKLWCLVLYRECDEAMVSCVV